MIVVGIEKPNLMGFVGLAWALVRAVDARMWALVEPLDPAFLDQRLESVVYNAVP